MISISVCLIVKNEEHILSRCLKCLQKIADEIVIVDTGSSDNTKKVAEGFTKNIYNFKWIDDFSAARNFAISKATKEYIYMADADEIIDEENQKKFMILKSALLPEIDVVQMKYTNQLSFSTIYNFNTEYRPKLFKRIQTFKYIDPIHEQLKIDAVCFDSDIIIKHMPLSSHTKRDLDIFLKATSANEILSERLNNLYAKELFVSGNDEDFCNAQEYFEKIMDYEYSSIEQKNDAACVLMRCARIKKDNDKFLKMSLFAAVGEPCSEACCEIGDYYMSLGDFKYAQMWFKMAYEDFESVLNIHYSGDIALNKLSECCLKQGKKDESDLYRQKAEKWCIPEN